MTPMFGLIASSISGNLSSNFDSIQTVTVGSGGQASISFSSIPSTYKHLQIRCFAQTDYSAGSDAMNVTLNSDTTTTYWTHQLFGNGSTVTANAASAAGVMYVQRIGGQTSGKFGTVIIDFLDYTSTNKNKTMRSLGGVDWNGTSEGQIYLNSGNYPVSSTAVSTIKLAGNGGNFTQYSSFALYGIKG